ncbi:hypothetical protein [Sphaerotilus natans]|uniref:hypothetical protein n=1 Tax=Sphaerotilus natans TaxID=34103 RepID=UPI00138DED98|nr:hypothetical protein [Sphaerotilus natans]
MATELQVGADLGAVPVAVMARVVAMVRITVSAAAAVAGRRREGGRKVRGEMSGMHVFREGFEDPEVCFDGSKIYLEKI